MMLTIPAVQQRFSWDCGPASVRAVLSYFGLRVPYDALIAELGATDKDGTDPRMMEGPLRRAGLFVQAGEMTVADLKYHAKAGRPVICLVTTKGGHYVVSAGVQRGRVFVMDPANGPASYRAEAFAGMWFDRCRIGAEFRNWALAVWRQD